MYTKQSDNISIISLIDKGLMSSLVINNSSFCLQLSIDYRAITDMSTHVQHKMPQFQLKISVVELCMKFKV